MRAGLLRHIINIERRVAAFNDLGHESNSWKRIAAKIRCRVEELSGRELERAKQQVAETTHRVTLRIPQDCETTDRFIYNGKILKIASRTEDEMGSEAIFLCVREDVK